MTSRRQFLIAASIGALGVALPGISRAQSARERLGVSQYSFHRYFNDGSLSVDRFPSMVSERFGGADIEWVASLLPAPEEAGRYHTLMQNMRASGIRSHAILVDGPVLGNTELSRRQKAMDFYKPWIDAAHTLGCRYIRVNAWGPTDIQIGNLWHRLTNTNAEGVQQNCAESIHLLLNAMKGSGMTLLIENHLDYSSRAEWLAELIRLVADPQCAVMLDFGNWMSFGPMLLPKFHDAVEGCRVLAPYTASVSAKAHQFTADGNEESINYPALVQILESSGYRGKYVAEFETYDDAVDVHQGIQQTLALLERLLVKPVG